MYALLKLSIFFRVHVSVWLNLPWNGRRKKIFSSVPPDVNFFFLLFNHSDLMWNTTVHFPPHLDRHEGISETRGRQHILYRCSIKATSMRILPVNTVTLQKAHSLHSQTSHMPVCHITHFQRRFIHVRYYLKVCVWASYRLVLGCCRQKSTVGEENYDGIFGCRSKTAVLHKFNLVLL